MKKLKKVIPIIIAFIIGISTTVCAATVFNSKDITYSSTATTKKNVKDSLDELYTKASKIGECPEGYECYKPLADVVKVGDYIKMTPTSTSYTISKDLTGYSEDQTINPSELNLWRVIKVNTDGTVEMVSHYASSMAVYLRGLDGYVNSILALNTIANQYTDGKHVEGLRHIGYNDQSQIIMNPSVLSSTSAPWVKNTSKYNQWKGCDPSVYLCGTDEAKGSGDIGYVTDYDLVNSAYGTLKASSPDGSNSAFWLASRVYGYSNVDYWSFNVRIVTTSGSLSAGDLCIVMSNDFLDKRNSYDVRPIAILKSTTELLSGSGTLNSPYILK